MNISAYYKNINYDIEFDHIETNSKKVKRNTLFICIKGHNYDGHDFILEAIKNGAVIIISEKNLNINFPFIKVKNTKKELIKLIFFYLNPNNKLNLIGVTGTDGKTTTSTYIYNLFKKYNNKVLNLGTNGLEYDDKIKKTLNTTPDLLFISNTINYFYKKKYKYLIMEVSAQAISEQRVKNLNFKYKIFTNFSHEHLEYYKSIDDYFNAKKSFFNNDSINIINIDDEKGIEIINQNKLNAIKFGKNINADFKIINIINNKNHSLLTFKYLNKLYKNIYINTNKIYNIYNVIPAIIIGINEKISFINILSFLKNLPYIEGRYLKLEKDNIKIIIDFAHTPNGLYNLIKSEKETFPLNKLKIVIGAAGGKDKTKRPLIGDILFKYVDYIYFTSEDPKHENPLIIINDIINTNLYNPKYEIIINRKDAIKKAILEVKDNETIFITGKGLENYQKIYDKNIIHNDYLIAKEFLKKK